MTLAVEKSPSFHADVTGQFEWYFDKVGEELAWRFFKAVDIALLKLSRQPDLGRSRHFRNPLLNKLNSFRVEPPFRNILIFYRLTTDKISAERLIHGARDLPRRLLEPPG